MDQVNKTWQVFVEEMHQNIIALSLGKEEMDKTVLLWILSGNCGKRKS